MALLELNNISKIYRIGGEIINALSGIKLKIDKNEYLSITGASGSGKSTIMNIMGCLDTPSGGEYRLDRETIYSDNPNDRKEKAGDRKLAVIRNHKIGFIFQSFNLLPDLTALQNVEMPMIYANVSAKERQKRAREMLKTVNLKYRMTHKPNELSGGQKQRVAIARALVNQPSIILADEPTGNLDSKTSLEIMAFMDELHAAGNTIILVTHENNIAARTHRQVCIHDGKIISDKVTACA